MRHGGPIDPDVVVITELEELLSGELHAIVRDDGVWDPKAMDDVKEEQHGLLKIDCGDQSSLYPLCKLLSVVFEIPWVPRMRVYALEVFQEDLF